MFDFFFFFVAYSLCWNWTPWGGKLPVYGRNNWKLVEKCPPEIMYNAAQRLMEFSLLFSLRARIKRTSWLAGWLAGQSVPPETWNKNVQFNWIENVWPLDLTAFTDCLFDRMAHVILNVFLCAREIGKKESRNSRSKRHASPTPTPVEKSKSNKNAYSTVNYT